MSWRLMAALVAGLGVAGCGGNPFTDETDAGSGGGTDGGTDTGTDTGTDSSIPDALKGNLESVTYSEAAGTLTAVIVPLDASPRTVTFKRNDTYDVTGFQAFTHQETSSNRIFLALFNTSADGAVTAGVAGSGQFTEMVWGSNYTVNTEFVAPTEGGLASYSGRYAGILNTGVTVPGPGAPFDPMRPARVEGDVLINADFTDGSVEGGIRNRTVAETGAALDDLFLQITEITEDGTFAGTVVFNDQADAGSYAGAFGGTGATAVAGAIEVTPVSGNNDLLERGVFVADVCVPGDPSPCP